MKCLVTGGAGFLGSHIAKRLLSTGDEVVIMDDLSGGFIENIPEEVWVRAESILDVDHVNSLFDLHRFDYVYHLAAYAAENLSHFIKRFNYQNNVIGSVNLINAAVNFGVKRFVFTSSIAVYGAMTPPFTEQMIPRPEDSYGIAKYAIEQELRISKELFGLDYTIFRPHNVYGPGQNIGDRYRNVIGIFMNQCLKGEPMTIFGDGEQLRAFSYIDDVANEIADCFAVPSMRNDVFNIGGDVVTSINDLSHMVAEAMDVPYKVKYLPARHETMVASCDHSKLQALGIPYRAVMLEEGLPKMAEWVKKQGPRETKPFSEIEIRKNLPESWR